MGTPFFSATIVYGLSIWISTVIGSCGSGRRSLPLTSRTFASVGVLAELDRREALLDLQLRLDRDELIGLDRDLLLEGLVAIAAVDLDGVGAGRHVPDLLRQRADFFAVDGELQAAALGGDLEPVPSLARGERDVVDRLVPGGHPDGHVRGGRVAGA